MLSAAFTRSGLGTRLANHVLLRVGTRTDRVLLGILVVGTAISMWIPDIAVAAMLLPIAVGLLRDAGLQPGQSQFGRALDDRGGVRSAHRRHRDAGRHIRQPGCDRAAEATRGHRHLVRDVDGLR